MSKVTKAKKAISGKDTSQGLVLPANITHILALDLSLNATGYCLYNLCSNDIKYDVIDVDGARDIVRLHLIVKTISSLIEGAEVAFGSTLVVLENFAFARANQAHQIGMLHGVVRYALWKDSVQFILVAPMQLKKWVTGKGNADKNLVLKEIYKRYGFDVEDDNVADAIGLMTLTRALLGKHDKPLVAFQQEVVSKLMTASAQ